MITILFAGPAGAGKTSTLRILRNMRYQNASFFDEIATNLLSSRDEKFCKDKKKFQEAIANLQLQQLSECQNSGADVCLFDRGLPDFFVYDAENAEQMLSLEEAFAPYDYIFYFREFPLHLISEGNGFRKESSLSEIKELVETTRAVYEKCPDKWKIFLIPIFSSPEKKAVYVADLINELLEEPVFSIPKKQ